MNTKVSKEIKFRAWCEKDQMMYMNIQNGIQFEDGSKYTFDKFLTTGSDDYHQWRVMQFTGLKDKDNKDIYEGDIFRIEEDGDGEYVSDKMFYVVIVWVQEWAMFCSLLARSEYQSYLREGIKALDEPMFWTYTLEDTDSRKHFLCGNIYENPNLLSQ